MLDKQEFWSALFDMEKIKKLKKKATFGMRLTTDGVAASISFNAQKLEPEKPVKQNNSQVASPIKKPDCDSNASDAGDASGDSEPVVTISGPGFYRENAILPDFSSLVAIDPGTLAE